MQKFRWQLLIVLITGLVVGLILFFQQSQTTQEAVSTPNPISGGRYTEALVGNFLRLNPMLDHFNQADCDIDKLIFSSLIRFDSNGLPVGDLAESWSVSSDAAVFIFNLRLDAVWHDGQPVTAQDVIYTVSLLQSGSKLIPEDLREFWPQITVNPISDSSIEFALPVAFAPFLDYMNFQVLPAHLLGNLSLDELVDHPFNLNPIGSGPYRFDSLETDNGLIKGVNLISYEYYFDGRPFIDEIRFRYYPDEKAALDAYLAGEVDGLSKIKHEDLKTVLNQTGLNLYSSKQPKLCIVFLNQKNETAAMLQNADFRKVLMAGINRQAIVDEVLFGQAVMAQGPIMPDNWAFFDGQESYRFDPDKARQILFGMGFTQTEGGGLFFEGAPVQLDLLVQDDLQHMAMLKCLRQIGKIWTAN